MHVIDDLRAPAAPQNGHAAAAPVAEAAPADVAAIAEIAPDDQADAAAPDAEAAPEEAAPEEEGDPLEAFLAQGRRTLERLEQEEARVTEDRELLRLELDELDAKLVAVRAKRVRVGRAISAALRTLEPPAEPEPVPAAAEAPSTELVPVEPDPLFERAIIEPPKPPRRVGPGRKGQQAWLAARLRAMPAGQTFTVAELVPAFAERFGFAPADGVPSRVSIILGKLQRDDQAGVTLAHVARGTYRVGGAAEPEPDDARAAYAERLVRDAVDRLDAARDAGLVPEAAPEPEAAPASSRAWVFGKFAEQRLWTVRALVDEWVKEHGGEREPARSLISKTISGRMTGEVKTGPQLVRVAQGLYEAVPAPAD